mmetsp:Transcript_23560/g.58707  ORF Transcript_23560/g.58707 Transcript_23560/m.58707 type:complete len:216 (+) Transcript_23560:869-1516(+)
MDKKLLLARPPLLAQVLHDGFRHLVAPLRLVLLVRRHRVALGVQQRRRPVLRQVPAYPLLHDGIQLGSLGVGVVALHHLELLPARVDVDLRELLTSGHEPLVLTGRGGTPPFTLSLHPHQIFVQTRIHLPRAGVRARAIAVAAGGGARAHGGLLVGPEFSQQYVGLVVQFVLNACSVAVQQMHDVRRVDIQDLALLRPPLAGPVRRPFGHRRPRG